MRRSLAAHAVAAAAALLALTPQAAFATNGDLYAAGTAYQAATYAGHANLFGGGDDWTVDINANEGDTLREVYAPERGRVSIYSRASDGLNWGNSIVWTSADGHEQIHVAHLNDFVKLGDVEAGDLIAHAGSTGNSSSSHMHVSRSWDGLAAPLVLSGHRIVPALWYNGTQYYSAGPLQQAMVPGTLSGRVTSGGVPLAGATVSLPGVNAVTTAQDGTYVLKDLVLGAATVTYARTGFVSRTLGVSIAPGGMALPNVDLAAITRVTRPEPSPSIPRRRRPVLFHALIYPSAAASSGTAKITFSRKVTVLAHRKVDGKRRHYWKTYYRTYKTVTMRGDDAGLLTASYKPRFAGRWRMAVSYSASPGSGFASSTARIKYFVVK